MSREYDIRLDAKERKVSVTHTPEGYTVRVGKREFSVTDVSVGQGTLAFLVNRKMALAHVSDGDGMLQLSIGGRNYGIAEEAGDSTRMPGAGVQGGDGTIRSPMPGSIVRVCVGAGERVEAGDPVVVLESMKMQNEIAAPIAGTVVVMECSVGQQVGFGDMLASIAPAGGDADAGGGYSRTDDA